MKIAEITINGKPIIEIEKSSLAFACNLNKLNFREIMKPGLISPLKKTSPSFRIAVLQSLLWLKQNSFEPIEFFEVENSL